LNPFSASFLDYHNPLNNLMV